MGKSFSTLRFLPEMCDGCGACMTACAVAKSGTEDLAQSRIRILPGGPQSWELALCRQCAEPKCVMNCPSSALVKNAATGVVDWDMDKCVNCLLCTAGCSYGGIVYEPALQHVSKCDTCDGKPACVEVCSRGALRFDGAAASVFNDQGDREDLFAPGLSACQGCNSELLIRHTLRRVGPDTVVATPPGCIPGMGTVGYNGKTGTKVPVFHPLLTNTASMLAGVKRQYDRVGRKVTALALAGDGGTADVGFQSLSGAAERNEPILFVCVDNEGYMNTGMQASGCTTYGSWTSTTPVGERLHGKGTDAKDLPTVMMMHNCAYVATASTAFLDDYHAKLEKALEVSKTGFAYLHVYAPCPTGWRFPSAMTTEVCRRQVETNFVTLWEYERGKALAFSRPVDRPRPLEDYLTIIGKYKHLDPEQVEHIRSWIDRKVRFLQKFAAESAMA